MTNNNIVIVFVPLFRTMITRGVDMSGKKRYKSENIERSKEIKKVIAKECGIALAAVHNKTLFMSDQNISYFDCVGVLYTLQHKFHVCLPESSYVKYRTVGDLIRDVNRQSIRHSR